MSTEERESLIENLYVIVQSSDAKTIDDLDKQKIRSLICMQRAFRNLGRKKQAELLKSVSKVFFNNTWFFYPFCKQSRNRMSTIRKIKEDKKKY